MKEEDKTLEVWKDVVGYEGYYKVSNIGNVKSLDRITNQGRRINGVNMKQFLSHNGYKRVALAKDGLVKKYQVHRLVAIAFIENEMLKPFINHVDENKTNNCVDNLQWVTSKENNNYGNHNRNVAIAQSRKIKVIYSDNTYEVWESQSEFARNFGCSVSGVNLVLNGKNKQLYGIKFEYLE